MKKIFLLIIISFSRTSYAQTWNEWFNQKKAQIQYLLGQVAANEIYIGYAEKGEKRTRKKGIAIPIISFIDNSTPQCPV